MAGRPAASTGARAALGVVLASCVLAACGGTHSTAHQSTAHQSAAQQSTARHSATHQSARAPTPQASVPQPSQRCGTPDEAAVTVRFRARDGAMLDGAIVGQGPTGVVLLHEYPGPMCGWWPYAAYLSHHRVHALLFDFGCLGLSTCPRGAKTDPTAEVAAAMAVLRAHGARSIALLGASLGGVVAVMAGAKLDPSAIIDLSGERDLGGLLPGARLDSSAPAPALHAPALFVVARGDRYVSVGEMRAIYRRAGSATKRLEVLPPSAGHGWDMLLGPNASWSPLARQIVAFIRHDAKARG